MKRILVILSLLLLPTALSTAAAPAPAITYEIEALIFENTLPELEAGEFWTRRDEKKPDSAVVEAMAIGENAPADAFLSVAATELENSGHHHVLAHRRWRQNAEAKSESKPVRISSEGMGLEGDLRLFLSRFLYLDIDLVFQKTVGQNSSADTPAPARYRIDERRRIKTAEIHYFDHPKFGALVRVVQTGKQ